MTGNFIKLYQNHGGAIGYWKGWVEAGGLVVIQYAKKLDGKPVRKEYQAHAKNVGRANATTPFEQGVSELQSKARLKIDKGYVRTKEEAKAPSTNSLGLLKPMLATPFEKVKPEKIEWHNAFVQPKLDGHRALYIDGTLYSRQGKVLDLPHIVEAIKSSGLGHLHLDGELYIHGYTLQELSKLIKKHRPETLSIEYHVYDHIEDISFSHRYMMLEDIAPHWPSVTPIKLVETQGVSHEDELLDHHARYRNQGYEGTMLRFGSEGYKHGKRARTLLKLKEFQDAEFEIVDVKEGKPYVTESGTYRVPVWVCETDHGKEFTVTAAGTMEEKHEQWVDRKSIVQDNPLITVKFHYKSEAGIPQLPVALRFRDDL